MKQVQKLSDNDIFKLGFSFDKYISWTYFKTLINDLITSKINNIPTPTLNDVVVEDPVTTAQPDFQIGIKTASIDLNDILLTTISIQNESSIVADRVITVTLDGVDYKILAQRI